jgi:hypothetical protein
MQNKSIDVQTGKKWKFHCNPEAFPSGVIKWFKVRNQKNYRKYIE